jgi:hypothetical protein
MSGIWHILGEERFIQGLVENLNETDHSEDLE